MRQYTKEEWQEKSLKHHERFQNLVGSYLDQKRDGAYHPIIDFLFQYFSFPASKLARWSPGSESTLLEAQSEQTKLLGSKYLWQENSCCISSLSIPSKRLGGFLWISQILKQTELNPPVYNCYGLHEWAMVYQSSEVRHKGIPFRLPQSEIDAIVKQSPLQCTHHDALRFYPPEALSFNLHQPSRKEQKDFEQIACLHANMDLYKWAYKLYPWIDSDTLMEAFELALECRVIDMQASPYDLSHYGFEPIPIETKAGRALYVQKQNDIQFKAKTIRQKILKKYKSLIQDLKKRQDYS